MTLDYATLWVLVILNTLAIMLVIRQLAAMPHVARRAGPKVGTEVPAWSLESIDGRVVRSADLPTTYTLLFVASGCRPCHALFAELQTEGPAPTALYIVARGDAPALAREAQSERGPLYDLFLRDDRAILSELVGVPGTPYAVAVRDGRVVAAKAVPTAEQLARVSAQASMEGGLHPRTAP